MIFRKKILVLGTIILFFCPSEIFAQTTKDSTQDLIYNDSISNIAILHRYRYSKSELINAEIISFPIMITALTIEEDKDEFSNLRRDYIPSFQTKIDNYTQYLPAAVMLGMKLGGVEGQSSWSRMLTADAFSVAIMASTVNTLKYTVKSRRPDGTAQNSFPSGHTATAFMTATMLSNEYGWRSPLISIGAYTSATLTGLFRMANNRHWLSDVLFGAGIGVLSTQTGYFLTDLIYKDKGLNKHSFTKNKISRDDCPSFFGIYLGYDYPLGRYKASVNRPMQYISGSMAGMEGAYFLSEHIGIGGRITALNICYDETKVDESIDNLAMMGGLYYSYPFNKNWSVNSKLITGWCFYTSTNFDGVRYKASNGICTGTGISLTYRLNRSYNMHLFCDYTIYAPYRPFFSEYMHHVSLGGSTSISF